MENARKLECCFFLLLFKMKYAYKEAYIETFAITFYFD